jgi:putative membrane protein
MPALFAYVHSLSMIALGALLFVQLLGFAKLHDREELNRFFGYCVGMAAAAAIMLASGLALLLWSGQASAFYLRNPVFYIKLALFAAMLLVAITPARLIMQWHRDAVAGTLPEPASILFVRRYFIVELVLFLLVPLAASISAQGIGLQSSPS